MHRVNSREALIFAQMDCFVQEIILHVFFNFATVALTQYVNLLFINVLACCCSNSKMMRANGILWHFMQKNGRQTWKKSVFFCAVSLLLRHFGAILTQKSGAALRFFCFADSCITFSAALAH